MGPQPILPYKGFIAGTALVVLVGSPVVLQVLFNSKCTLMENFMKLN